MTVPNDAMNSLIRDAWQMYRDNQHERFLVKPSIPILFFGDSERYFSSELKVITLGLNPSKVEFPDEDRFRRFNAARSVYPQILEGSAYEDYLRALNGYFRKPPNDPYIAWFNSFEPLLNGLECSYYAEAANRALHTDLCSPLATDPTWSRLPKDDRAQLLGGGVMLWHKLVETLAPDVIIASVARHHLDRISFERLGHWRTVYTVVRDNPFNVELARLRLTSGKNATLVFGKAANTPFGTVSTIEKRNIGNKLKDYLNAE
jgi:hypothetical protein